MRLGLPGPDRPEPRLTGGGSVGTGGDQQDDPVAASGARERWAHAGKLGNETPRRQEAVVEGERIGAPEVVRIRDAEASGLLRRGALEAREARTARSLAATYHLGKGESEVLAISKRSGRCLVDEGRASRVARSLGIVPIPTILLPVMGYRAGNMTLEGEVALVRRLAVVTGASAEAVFEIEDELSGGSG